jgi:metal-responsive CopG/Arc/MetJ family transcriptional regulator
MKITVSIPNEIVNEAKRLARQKKKSPSRLISDALNEYLACHSRDKITEAINAVCAEIGNTEDPFFSEAPLAF